MLFFDVSVFYFFYLYFSKNNISIIIKKRRIVVNLIRFGICRWSDFALREICNGDLIVSSYLIKFKLKTVVTFYDFNLDASCTFLKQNF